MVDQPRDGLQFPAEYGCALKEGAVCNPVRIPSSKVQQQRGWMKIGKRMDEMSRRVP
jgi:hypothetical protein